MNLLAKRGGFRHHVRMVTPAFSDCINKLGVDEKDVIPFGRNKAKISLDVLDKPAAPGKLILVSAITPTPSGEGKTTVSIGLAQGLQAIGKKVCLALRQPSMGPVFGRKGGATGGGKSSLTPAEEINMHFTGDFHAITSAHNLISAIIDNAMFFHTLNRMTVIMAVSLPAAQRGRFSTATPKNWFRIMLMGPMEGLKIMFHTAATATSEAT